MAKRIVKHNTTSRIEHVFLLDSASTTGAGKTGVTAASITAFYLRPGDASATSISLASGTLGTYSASNNWTEVSATNMPGVYEFDVPNAVFASGADHAIVQIKGTGIAPVVLEYDLVAYDSQDTVRLGLTALPNAASGTAGAIITSGTGTAQLSVASGAVTVGTNNDKTGYALTQSFPANFSSLAITVGGAVTAGTVSDKTGYSLDASQTFSTTGSVGSVTGTVGSVTGNVGGNVVGSVNSVTSAVTVGTINAGVITAASIASDAINASKLDADVSTEIATGVWANATRTLSSGGNSGVADAVWKSSLTVDSGTTAWPNNTFGNSVLRAYNNTNAFIKTTGSGAGHVGADVHEMQPNVITSGALDATAISEIADGVWDEAISGHLTAGSTGAALNAAGSAGDPWSTLVPGAYGAGTAGYIIGTNLDATVSSRSTLTAANVWANATRELTSGANIVLAKGTGVTGFNDLDAAGIRSSVGLASANLDTQLGDLPTASENADAVWDETLSGHLTAGSTGAALNAAGSAGDPWATVLPGAYGAGTAGKIIGDNINATISSRLASSAITLNSGAVTVGTNNDKTGYSLTQSFPANFSTMAISATGIVSANTTQLSGQAVTASNPVTFPSSVGTSTLTAANVWDTNISGYTTAGLAGTYLKGAGSSGDPWSAALPGAYSAGTAGYIIGTNLDALVSTRSTLTASGVWSAATRELTSGTNIVLSKGTGITGFNDLNASDVRSAVGLASANLDTQLGDLPTAAENADAVWDEALSGHSAAGSTGEALTQASTGGDPWSTAISSYTDVTKFGGLVKANLDATVSSRLASANISLTGGAVTVGTNNDKSGYSLAANQTFSTTGSVGSVTGSVGSVSGSVGSVTGAVGSVTSPVTVGTNNDKTGYSLSANQTFSTTGAVGSVTGNVGGDVAGSVGSVAGNVTGSVNSVTSAVIVGSVNQNAIIGDSLANTAIEKIVDGTWDEVRGASRPAGSFGSYLDASVAGVQSTSTAINNSLTTVAGDVTTIKNNTDTVEAVTDKLNSTLQLVSGSTWRFTSSALALAPTGGAASYVPVTLPLGTNIRTTITFTQGATLPVREDILQQQDRTPLDLTGTVIAYELTKVDESSPTVYASATIVDAVAGRVRYTWQAGDLATLGTYRERWVITYPTGQVSVFGPLIKVS